MRRIINLPAHVQIEYKKHQDSLVDKSSFRNPSLVWKPKDVPAQRQGGYHKDYQNRDGQHRDGQHRDGQHRDGGHYNKEGTHREGGGGGYNKDHAPRDKGANYSHTCRNISYLSYSIF